LQILLLLMVAKNALAIVCFEFRCLDV